MKNTRQCIFIGRESLRSIPWVSGWDALDSHQDEGHPLYLEGKM